MDYRFVKIASYYPRFMESVYAGMPGLAERSYADQLKELMSRAFGWADFVTSNLHAIGADAHEIVWNCQPLQQAWAREHGLGDFSEQAVLLGQIRDLKPQVVFFEDALFKGDFIKELKGAVPSIRLILAYHTVAYTGRDLDQFRTFDAMLTSHPGFRDDFERHGMRAYRLNHAFEASLLDRIGKDNPYAEADVFFAGSLEFGGKTHNLRRQILLNLLARGMNLSLHGSIPRIGAVRRMASHVGGAARAVLSACGLGRLADLLPILRNYDQWAVPRDVDAVHAQLKPHLRKSLFGLEMFKALSKAKVGLNIHVDAVGDYAANMRLFEVPGVGACLLTDHKKNISDFFEPDKEVVTYRTAEEAVEKAAWLLAHESDRAGIAAAGQRRVLKEHTYAHRAANLDAIIRKML